MATYSETVADKKVLPRSKDASDTLSEAKQNLQEIAGKAGQGVRHFIEEGQEGINEATENYKSVVRRKPVQASLIALGTGFLLGMLARR